MYLQYFKYVAKHKINVFKTCFNRKLYLHAFTHDLSKFRPSEFIPYAKHFYGNYISQACVNNVPCLPRRSKQVTKEMVKEDFEKAWIKHYKRNKHHPEYWVVNGQPIDIPTKYLLQMVCDLEAMSLTFGGSAEKYYIENYDKFNLTRKSRLELEHIFEFDIVIPKIFAGEKTLKEFFCETEGYATKICSENLKYLYNVDCYKVFGKR